MDPALGPPNADTARQAIHSIRGYEYQILAAALAWVDLEENGLIYLEVAEDYAHVVGGDIEAVQVKATCGSGAVTLNTPAVRDAIESFVDLAGQNPSRGSVPHFEGSEIVPSIDFPRVCPRAGSPHSRVVGGSSKSTDRTRALYVTR